MRLATVLLMAVPGGAFGSAPAALVTLPAVLDAYVSSAAPDASHAGDPYLSVETTSGVVERCYIKFDVSSLAGMTVSSATLRVWVIRENSGGGGPDLFELYPVFSPWAASLTYTQSEALTQGALVVSVPSADYGTSNTPSPPQAVDFDVTSLVESWASGSVNHGLVIRFPATANADIRFADSGYSDPAIRPSLTVTASAPAPAPAPAPPPPSATSGSSSREGENGDGGINDKCGGATSAGPGSACALLAGVLALGFATRPRRRSA